MRFWIQFYYGDPGLGYLDGDKFRFDTLQEAKDYYSWAERNGCLPDGVHGFYIGCEADDGSPVCAETANRWLELKKYPALTGG